MVIFPKKSTGKKKGNFLLITFLNIILSFSFPKSLYSQQHSSPGSGNKTKKWKCRYMVNTWQFLSFLLLVSLVHKISALRKCRIHHHDCINIQFLCSKDSDVPRHTQSSWNFFRQKDEKMGKVSCSSSSNSLTAVLMFD